MTRDGAKPQDGFLCVTSWNNKFIKFRMTTLSDKESEATARNHMAAWVPILWGGGQRNEAKKPDSRQPQRAQQTRPQQQQQPQRRPPPRRFVCPEGYICR